MARIRIGVVTAAFQVPDWREQVRLAAKVGVEAVQFYNTQDELNPATLSRSGREDVKQFVASQRLAISAVCSDEGLTFDNPEIVEKAIARNKEFLQLAVDLGPGIVTTRFGPIPDDPDSVAWRTMHGALEELGAFAAKIGGLLAAETGQATPALLINFYKTLTTGAIRVNYDPANLTKRGIDAAKGVFELKDYIVHAHAKDAKVGGNEEALGNGDVKWPEFVSALEAIDYRGFLAIERERGDTRLADVERAVAILRGL